MSKTIKVALDPEEFWIYDKNDPDPLHKFAFLIPTIGWYGGYESELAEYIVKAVNHYKVCVQEHV